MDNILVTGGSGALGAVVTTTLIREGYGCIVPYRNIESAQQLRARVVPQQRDQLLLIEANMSIPEDVAQVFEAALSFGELYGLVHLIGGIRGFQPVHATPIEEWNDLMTMNLSSFFLSARLAMAIFERAKRGRIVSISAMGGLKPSANQTGYGVSKAGVIALSKILADEGRAFGVTANCIAPGIIRTPANLSWGSVSETASWVSPEEIAAAVVYFLCSEAASVNGSVLQLFGGLNV
jgi:NAD(P)-dependent dehydrogenase (short-subunit alcohol dehydrogenase family)